RSAGVDQTVHHILQGVRRARDERRRQLVLVTGVPGAGKTLVGLQVAHAAALEEGFRIGTRRTRGSPATFLSGNGPLVQVLQNALKSTAFVQDMHRYIREYGIERTDRQPWERVIVFDEAQRAWDRAKLGEFYEKRNLIEAGSARSEPELLLDIAGRVDGWAMVVALVGEGQAIHTGEEAGLPGWIEAVRGARDRWEIEAPPAVAALFEAGGLTVVTNQALGLDRSLRTQGAEYLHLWIQAVLDRGDADAARLNLESSSEARLRIEIALAEALSTSISESDRVEADAMAQDIRRRSIEAFGDKSSLVAACDAIPKQFPKQ
ncbi:MAG: DNA/RNA helicase domain-containing protein, partial [bacterium]